MGQTINTQDASKITIATQTTAGTSTAASDPAQVAAEAKKAKEQQADTIDELDADDETRTVEDIRYDILCGVDVPDYEREMEIKDIYEKMQNSQYEKIFGATVERAEFFKHLQAFREAETEKIFKRKIDYTEYRIENYAVRAANDPHFAKAMDKDGDGAVTKDEIKGDYDRAHKYFSLIEERYNNIAWNMVLAKDLDLRKGLVRNYMEVHPKFQGFVIEGARVEDDKIIFSLQSPNGDVYEFVPEFDRGKDGVLDRTDSVSGMTLDSVKKFEAILDRQSL